MGKKNNHGFCGEHGLNAIIAQSATFRLKEFKMKCSKEHKNWYEFIFAFLSVHRGLKNFRKNNGISPTCPYFTGKIRISVERIAFRV